MASCQWEQTAEELAFRYGISAHSSVFAVVSDTDVSTMLLCSETSKLRLPYKLTVNVQAH